MELLIVISVILVLAGLLIPAIGLVRKQVKNVQCSNNLRQIAITIDVFRKEHDEKFPESLVGLIQLPGFELSPKLLLCPMDDLLGGDPYMNRDPNWQPFDLHLRLNESGSSYSYEASSTKDQNKFTEDDIEFFFRDLPKTQPIDEPIQTCQPPTGSVSWADGKLHQQQFGNLKDPAQPPQGNKPWKYYGAPFPISRLPIVRCYHHVPDWSLVDKDTTSKVNNVSLGFNVLWTTPYWEKELTPNIP